MSRRLGLWIRRRRVEEATMRSSRSLLLGLAVCASLLVAGSQRAHAAESTGPIPLDGTPVTCTVSAAGDTCRFTFTGTTGKRVFLSIINNQTIDFWTSVALQRPDGTTLASKYAGYGDYIDTTTLPVDGTYSIFVDPPGTSTGYLSLRLWDVPPDGTGTMAIDGPAETVAVGTPGQNASRTFAGDQGQRIFLNIANPYGSGALDYWTRITIRKPDGTTLASTDARWGYFIDTTTLPATGTYTIFVNPPGASTGSLSLRLYEVPPDDTGTIVIDGATSRVTITVPGQNGSRTFFGSAGQPVRLDIGNPYGPGALDYWTSIVVLRPDGSTLLSTDASWGRTVNFTLPVTGTYTIRVNPPGASTGSLTLGLNQTGPFLPAEQAWGPCYVPHPALGMHAWNPTGCDSDPVNTLTGAYTTAATDLSLPAIGVLPFAWVRSYTSPDGRVGRLGRGWIDSYDIGLELQPSGDVVLRAETGQRVRFFLQADGSFRGAPGARSNLQAVTGGYELVRHDQVRYAFDGQGRVTSIRDRNGQGLMFAYDATGRLATVTDSASRQIGVSHNADGTLSRVTLADGRGVEYGYTSGLLTSVTDLRGGTTTYRYDAAGRLDKITDQNGNTVVENVYGANGRVTSQLDGEGNQTLFAWDAATQTATTTDARGKQWKSVYQNNVLVKRIDPLGNTSEFGYDIALNLRSVKNPRGHTTTMTYDGRGNLLTRTTPAPLSYQESFTYDTQNNVVTARDGRGNTTSYGYDARGNLIRVTGPDPDGPGPAGPPVAEYGRDPTTGLVTSVTDPRGKLTRFEYDAAGNRTKLTTPLGNVTTFAYDGSGRMSASVEPRGNVTGATPGDYRTTFAYDAGDNLTSTTDPLGNTTSSAYDPAGRLTGTTDAKGRTTGYGYDRANRLLSVMAPDGTVTRYGYDPVGNLISRTDANNNATSYSYDDAGRLVQVVSPIGQTWSYAYDPAGNRTQVVDANGNATTITGDGTTTLSYDELNRLTRIDYSDTTPDVSFAYDASSNRTSMSDGAGTETYAYDPLDRLTQVSRGAESFAYGYDPASNLTRRTYPDGTVIDYGFDDDGRLASVATGGQSTSYGYDPAGNLATTTPPAGNGYVETRLYDRAGRLTEVKNAKGTSVLSKFTYTLDPVGNPTTLVTSSGTETYKYDQLDRLTEVCLKASCTKNNDPYIRWSYDPVGNRLTETRPGASTSYSYNPADQMLAAGSVGYGYDANGDQTSAGARSFSYDLAGRLASTTSGTSTISYTYDGDGKRLQATAGSTTTKYLWDTNAPLPLLALERDGADALLRRYTYGAGLLAMTTPAGDFYYHQDALGSIANLTSSAGALQWSYSYEPFGALRSETRPNKTSPPTNLMRFTGQLVDVDTGLYHLRARQYDPATGRFLARDPLPPLLTDSYVSAYVYVNNQPTVFVDPSGLIGLPGWAKDAVNFVDNHREIIAGVTLAACGVTTAGGCVAVGVLAAGANAALNFRAVRSGEMTLGEAATHSSIDLAAVGLGRTLPYVLKHAGLNKYAAYIRIGEEYNRSFRVGYAGALHGWAETAKIAASTK